jgi:D-sedoheptulose 7-phosphate isomerase
MESILNRIREQLADGAAVKSELARTAAPDIERAAEAVTACLRRGGKVLFCGNGGSAADSQHLAAELVGRFHMTRRPLAAVALTTDTSILLAVANDMGFDEIFTRQVEALGRPGDLLVALSTSGNSKNVVQAVERARSLGMETVGLVGRSACGIDAAATLTIHVPADDPARIQEAHIAIGHILCDLTERALFGSD